MTFVLGRSTHPGALEGLLCQEERDIAKFKGTLERHARLSVIVSHVGCALPSLADRLNRFTKIPSTENPLQKIDVYGALARLHYDVAGTALPHALPGLLAIASAERLLYASDTPFTPPNLIQADARALVETDVRDDARGMGCSPTTPRNCPPAGWLASGAVPRMALEEPLIRSEYRCRPGARPGLEAESLKVGDDGSPRPG